jgi:hypothetical protein
MFLVVPAAVGFLLGLLTAILAERDLKRMEAGLRDPNGHWLVERAQERAVCAIILSLFGWPAGCVGLFVISQLVLSVG